MAIYSASSKSQLNTLLPKLKSGDTLLLEGGNYGALNLDARKLGNLEADKTITIASANAKNPAVFDSMDLVRVANLTFDGLKFDYDPGRSGSSRPFVVNNSEKVVIRDAVFDGHLSGGYGTGTGLWVTRSSNVTVVDSDFSKFSKAAVFVVSDGLVIRDNDFQAVSLDALAFETVNRVLIQDNAVSMRTDSGVRHKDMIQIGNNSGSTAPSSDIVIRGNVLVSNDTSTHGIYMGNNAAKNSNNIKDFFQNVLIENNTISSGQVLGLAVGETNGLVVRNNTVLQGTDVKSSRAADIPVIRFDKDSKNVTFTGNTGHKTPEAADYWEPTTNQDKSWTIASNKVVPLGTTASLSVTLSATTSDMPDFTDPATERSTTTDVSSSISSDDPDVFRFNGDKLGGQEVDVLSSVDFGNGDEIILNRYEAGTFRDVAGGNIVWNNKEGTFVQIDSLVDLQELATVSTAITALTRSQDDALVFRIAQSGGTHDIVLTGYGKAYLETYDPGLF